MSAFFIFLVAISAIALVWGFCTGFVRQIASLAGIVLGIIACRIFGTQTADWLSSMADGSTAKVSLTIMAYVILFVLVYLAAILVGTLAKKTLKAVKLGFIDRLAGALFKFFLWMFILSLALNLWCALAPGLAPKGVWAERVVWLAPAILGSETAAELKNSILKRDAQNISAVEIVVNTKTLS